MSRGLLLLLWLLALAPAAAQAQDSGDPEVAALRASFEYGKYAEVLDRAGSRIDRGDLGEDDLVELHKLAGLAAFNLGRKEDATRHLRALLRLDPDYSLDPFVVPPPAVAFLDALKQEMSSELEFLRQERRLRQEREKAAAERRERERLEAEVARRRAEEMARQVTVRTVEKRNFLVNFVPFGAGQFQQGRTSLGVVFAAVEGALAVTSIISFFAYESLFEEQTVLLDNVLDPDGQASLRVRYIPTNRRRQADTWQLLKLSSAAGFYTVYALGAVDALYHHEDQVIRTTVEPRADAPAPASAPASVTLRNSSRTEAPKPSARVGLYRTSGGLGAGLTLFF
ncbi:tetratricopeptide repeat protein [Pyxidicoccus fallax]|uniref:Tetratricopeptide repeat protein n=1 Tax=Pyxidicoccus fallax TaxID=394095 RepID=A0A848LZC7_9BACT|nr:tetratricopeptide repeat protein [Pyxidicoccus fallax]NMO23206.1 tetratricopeptide repeat protein [Pyxidicoccus fallax]NPC86145.1 tetratricopeptide repeat protein [Pyxidicoccus fallax]